MANFEKETGIKVVYDVFDSNEVLEGKLMAGSTGFDLVVPYPSFSRTPVDCGSFPAAGQKQIAGVEESRPGAAEAGSQNTIPTINLLCPDAGDDLGIGYNVDKVKAVLGENVPVDSWT